MSDEFPRWPPEWVDDYTLAADEVLAEVGPISFLSALRTDDKVLLSVAWPEGRRYLMVDPVGNEQPRSYRIGELSEDADVRRQIEGVWSQALERAKQMMDGELPLGPPPAGGGGKSRRPWRRNQG